MTLLKDAMAGIGLKAFPFGGQMLSRKVVSLGTKTSAASWQLTCTDTVVLV